MSATVPDAAGRLGSAPDWTDDAPTPKQRPGSADDGMKEKEKIASDSELETGTVQDQEAAVPTALSPPSSAPSGPPPQAFFGGQPNGGLVAWLQVASAFSVFFNTWGILNTFGNFQTYYESGALFTETSSNIAWIGSIQAYCVVALGLISGPIYDRGFLRGQLVVGGFMIVFGFMMLSICKTFWQVVLAQGFCIGIGAGLIFTPAIAILPTYFSTRLGLAIGLAASGSSIGGVIYPIMMYKLIDQVGFGWGVRAIGFVSLGTLLLPIFCMKMRFKPAKVRDIFDLTAFTDWPFVWFVTALTIGFVGLYVMLFYTAYFGLATGIADPEMAFYLVPVLNAASTFGRTIPNAISDVVGPLNLFPPAAVICGILSFCMIAVKSLAGLIVIAVIYGFCSGVFIALPGVCFVILTKDKSKIGTRIGMGFAACGFGILMGGPGGGAIIGEGSDLHWTSAWVYGGAMTMGSAVMLFMLRFYLTKGKLMVKI